MVDQGTVISIVMKLSEHLLVSDNNGTALNGVPIRVHWQLSEK